MDEFQNYRDIVIFVFLSTFYGQQFLPRLIKAYGLNPFLGVQFLLFGAAITALLWLLGTSFNDASLAGVLGGLNATFLGLVSHYYSNKPKKER